MTFAAWLTLAVVIATIALLASERVSAPVTIIGAVTILLVTGVIDSKQALAGFSNEAPVTIAALYVLTRAAETTGALTAFSRLVAGRGHAADGQHRATTAELTRLLVPATFLSSVVYNTPVVGLLAPQTSSWARRSGRSPSWYLLALNYAVTLGGLLTAIGTTTNVVVSGLLRDAGMRPWRLLEVTPVGVPIVLVGLVVLVLCSPVLTRSRQGPSASISQDSRAFTVEMVVPEGSALVGQTVAQAGMRNLTGVYLVQVAQGGHVTAPVAPSERLAGGAHLTFVGNVEHVLDLQSMPGLVSAEQPHFDLADRNGRRFFEVVVSPGASLVGSTLKEADFRGRYGAAVVAIHRAGERMQGKLGQVRLRAGDVLLLLGGLNFATRWRESNEFLVIAPLRGTTPMRREKAALVSVILVAFLAVAAFGVLSVLEAALLAAIAVVALGILTPRQARNSVDLNIVVVLCASFGLGNAIAASGLASHVAHLLIRLGNTFGDIGILLAVLVATVVVTQLVTNNAAAIVMFPVAIATAHAAGLNPRAFALAVTVGASCSFLTPIAYQTNLMVQGLGGYRFGDFTRVGWPIIVSTVAVAAVVIPWLMPLR